MDLRPIHLQDATSSSSVHATQANPDAIQDTTTETKSIRSSARVKAAKQKAQLGRDRDSPNPEEPGTSSAPQLESISTRSTRVSPIKTTRSREGKGKAKEVQQDSPRSNKRPRRNPPSTTPALIINEPPKDLKGKKRAVPEPEEEETAGPSTKRPRTSGYSLRSTSTSSQMTRKARTSTSKGKAALKSKMAAASTSRVETEDVEMIDAEYTQTRSLRC